MILVGLAPPPSAPTAAVDVNLGSLTIGSVTVQVTRLVAALASILAAGIILLSESDHPRQVYPCHHK